MTRLKALLVEYRTLPEPENFDAIERYLQTETASPWRLALRLNLGTLYYKSGYYSRAIEAFDAAWHQEGRHATPQLIPLRDAAIGELARMHARLGHVEALEKLLAEIGDRPLYGAASEAVAGAREGLWHMHNDAAVAYRCGPAALTSIVESAKDGEGATTLAISNVSNDALRVLKTYPSGASGVSMDEVVALADKTGMDLVPARRLDDAEIPLPAVVHWKVSHYAAIVGKRDGLYHVIDPTFGRDQWLSQTALDTESSGMFLIPSAQAAAPGWQRVALADTRGYYGRGYLTTLDQDDTRKDAPTIEPPSDCTGMCMPSVVSMLVSMRLNDKPVGYTPPVGPDVYTQVTYNQREASQPAGMNYFNIGPKWTLNWLSYVEDRPGAPGSNVKRYASGGGELDYSGYNATTKAFRRELRGGAQLVMVSASPVVYERRFANGGKEVYAADNGATTYPRRTFLSKIVDPQGNALTLVYDASMRLVQVRDALGQATTFTYAEAGNPLLVSRINDPFGRSAEFAYDALGRLSSITDAVGIVSAFTYDGDGTFIHQLQTPYGTTDFAATTTGTSRSLEITDPLGNVQRTEFTATAAGFPSTDTPPSGLGFQTNYQQYRNTFHWDAEAEAQAPGNYQMAQVSHWLHNGNIIPAVPESTKSPLETRIWYRREGQSNSIHLNGAVRESPSVTARRLPDGQTQLYRNSYTAGGNVTGDIDPLNRQLEYGYAANGVDLLTVKRKVGSGYETLASITYNTQHRPLTYTDQAGHTWTMTYNTRGQPTGSINPKGEVTDWHYDSNGYLVSITNANGKTAASYTYDAVGRVASATDAGGHTVKYAYDHLDRLTTTTYPDGTTTVNSWTALDITAVKDRLNRITHYEYNANRKLVKVTDPEGRSLRYGYDRANRLVSLVDQNGNTTRWERDIQGRVTAKVYPDSTMTRYAYDSAGRMRSQTDVLGQSRNYSYAKDDRVLGVSYGDAINPTPSVAYAWDAYFPRLTGMTDGIGNTAYSYHATGTDGAGRLAAESNPQGQVAYLYDVLGRLSGRSANGSDTVYDYDALGRVVGEGNDLGNFSYGYLGQTGQITALSLSGGKFDLALKYEPNTGDRRLKNLTYDHGPWSREFAYDTDSQARVLQQQTFIRGRTGRNPLSHENRRYGYDDSDRLVAVDGSNGAVREDYATDPAGNLIAQIWRDPQGSKSNAKHEWRWDAQVNENNQLEQTSEGLWQYDVIGNLQNDGKRSYRWDAENRLIQIDNLQTGAVTEIAYDGLGRRVRMEDRASAAGVPAVTRYLWCGNEICQKLDEDGSIAARYFGQGEIQGDIKLMYQRDRLGTVRAVVDPQTGEALGSQTFTAYGQDQQSDGVLPDRRYAGMFYHAGSGLYLTWHRAYDAEAGRWLSRDPIQEAGGVNLYGYVQGNPVSYRDPFGLDIALIFNGPTGYSNPVGHTAVAVTGSGVYSFGNGTDLGTSLAAYLLKQSPQRDTTVVVFKTTPEQDAAALKYLNSFPNSKVPPFWGRGLWEGDTCATRASEAARRAGVLNETSWFPWAVAGSAYQVMQSADGKGYKLFFISQNSTSLPDGLSQFEP